MKPVMVIGAVLVLGGVLYARYGGNGGNGPVAAQAPAVAAMADGGADKRLPVMLAPAKRMPFEERLMLSGNVLAKNTALVSPKVNGTLDAVYVDEGDMVVAGKTKLFQTDAVNLGKAVEIARQQNEVARCTVVVKRADHDRCAAEYEKAELDYKRYQKLFADKVISKSEYEGQEVTYKAQKAILKQSEVGVTLAEEQQKQAALNLSVAEKNLQDSLVLAPITGVVSKRSKEPGEMGQTGTAVLEIQDLSVLEVSAFLPEEYFARVTTGTTMLRLRTGDIDLGLRPVYYKSPCVSSNLRTFEIKALLDTIPNGVAPGRIAHVEVILRTEEGVGVKRDAVVKRGGEQVLFVCDGGTARLRKVRMGLETGGFAQILDNGVADGAKIIVQGQDFVDDGNAVQVTGEEQ